MRTTKPFADLTADDLMSHDVMTIPQEMSMRDAARLLLRAQVSGAPVVDARGRCVGILSATDFLQQAGQTETAGPSSPELPVTCGFQEKTWGPAGREVVFCKLPCGACSMQRPGEEGEARPVCSEPHAVPTDWQMVNVEKPGDLVHRYMTTDLVTADPETGIGDLAQRMIDGHIHRLVVVDELLRPVGVVSSTDILTAVACAEWSGDDACTRSESPLSQQSELDASEPDRSTEFAELGVGD